MRTRQLLKGTAAIAVLAIILATLISCAKNEGTMKSLKDSDILSQAEFMPVFPGGDTGLIKFISENVKYPESAKAQGIQGRVITRFCVNASGKVERVSVVSGASPELDKEAIRVVGTLPEFKPAMQDGKPVAVWYMVPITFRLK
jgi:protein TonB